MFLFGDMDDGAQAIAGIRRKFHKKGLFDKSRTGVYSQIRQN
jgi:hypothetical protein